MTANCPTCRAPFAIGTSHSLNIPLIIILISTAVTPDLEHIPEKYHQFIMSSIRRVYLDIDTNASEESEKERLEQQLALMDQQNRVFDKRVKTLQRDNYALADRCRTLENSSNIHAAGERHQRSDKERILTEMTELKKKYNNLKGKYKLLKDASYVSHYRIFIPELTPIYRSATSEQSRPKRKMTESPNLSVSPESSGVVGTSFAEHSRAMIPLPKRRRMDPGSELISCYGRPSVDPFTGLPSFVHIPISAPVMFPPPPIYVRRAQTPYRQPA